jgi:hypothetical protein
MDVRIPVNERIANRLYHTRVPLIQIKEDPERFEWDEPEAMRFMQNGFPALPREGTIYWTEGYVEALLLKSWLEANGFIAYSGWDVGQATDNPGGNDAWVVVTNKDWQ